MGEKDITEKILEDYNDVFADIINGLLFQGEQRVLPEALENISVHSQYKADDEKMHELERDVAKYWKEKEVQLAVCGIEVAWLSEEQIRRFRSDFRIVANFFVNKRKNKNYIPDDPTEIQHVDEVLKLLQVMTRDARYKRIFGKKKEGVHSMCDVAERLEKMGWEKGQMEGQIEGKILVYKNLRREGFDEKEARRLTELPEDMTLEQ